MENDRSQSQQRLELEIARLRQRLECAEDMRRAIAGGEVDAFVVGRSEDDARVMFLAGSPAHYGEIVQRMHQGALTVTRGGEILYANERVAQLLGQPLASLFTALLHEQVDAAERERVTEFLAGGATDATLDVALARDDGRLVPVRLTMASSGDGLASLLVTDLSTRHRLEEAESALRAIHNGEIDGVVVGGEQIMLLGDAHRPYELMIDRMQQGAVTSSARGDVLYANDRFAGLVGAPRESVLGGRLLEFFPLEEEPILLDLLVQAHTGPVQRDLTLRRSDGVLVPVAVAATPLDSTDAVALVVTDLSERKRHLEIEEANRRKDEFLAVLAHELRNPLAPIRNAVEILHRSNELGEPARYAVSIIGRQAATLTRLLDDLLDINRLNQGKITLQRTRVDLNKVVSGAVESAQPYISAKSHALSVELAREPIEVDVDPVRLAQVIVNLLSNAAKYTKSGGHVRVRVGREELGSQRSAIVRVADTGIGIPVAHLGRIFEPYAQLTPGSDEVASGLGLGLTLSRRLVEMHEGTLEATSTGPGQGSEFTIRLPIASSRASVVRDADVKREAPGAATSLRVLVADDNPDNLQSLAALLELLGHDTRTARDGAEAVTVADEFRPDVAFLDIGMPKLDGYAAARELRTRSWARDVALFALTGWGQADDRQRAEQAGFDSHLVKPIDGDSLSRLLDDAARRVHCQRPKRDAR